MAALKTTPLQDPLAMHQKYCDPCSQSRKSIARPPRNAKSPSNSECRPPLHSTQTNADTPCIQTKPMQTPLALHQFYAPQNIKKIIVILIITTYTTIIRTFSRFSIIIIIIFINSIILTFLCFLMSSKTFFVNK